MDLSLAKRSHRKNILDENGHSVRAIRQRGVETHKYECGQGNRRPPASVHVDKACNGTNTE
jgi:hypothetical protein